MSDPSGSTTYAYDRRGLLRTRRRRSSATRTLSLSGTRGAATTPYIAAASYQPFGPESSLVYGTGSLTRNATYDQRYRLTSFNVLNGATPLADYRYGLDAAGNITAIADNLDPRYSRSFAYDDLYRLTAANTGPSLWGVGSYSYDALGNRLAATLGSKVSGYTYVSATSKLSSVTEGNVTRNVVYDAAGNEQQVGGSAFAYSPRNYLDQGDGLRYVYDGSGVRVAQIGLAVGPLITQQPQSQPVCPGASATLRVTASGAASYQWQSFEGTNWNDIPGATSSSVSVTPNSATQYRVIVTNAAASTTSNSATVTPAGTAIEPASGIIYGDVNHDGVIDTSDVTLLRAVLAGRQPLSVPTAVADLNGDGTVDALDLSLLAAYATHTITCLPQFATTNASSLSRVTALNVRTIIATQIAANPTQYFFYTPEKQLLSQTELKAAGGQPQIAIDYIWFNGHPVAEERLASPTTRYTFTDHLGTPFLQTDTTAAPLWRTESEPFGTTYRTRTGTAADQRLRFPGQEYDDQTPEREYNIFRWYREGWGRYTQADPMGLAAGANLFAYALEDPVSVSDPMGLVAELLCKNVGTNGFKIPGAYHCRVRATCSECNNGGFPEMDLTFGMEWTGTPPYTINELKYPAGIGADYTIRRPITHSGMSDCQFAKCVQANNKVFKAGYTGKATGKVPTYSIPGPNSNTYANRLVETCGGMTDFPFGAIGTNDDPWPPLK